MKFKYPLLTAIIAVSGSSIVSAHGTMDFPVNRTYQCYQEGPESPTSEACKAAKAVGGPSPMYNWSAISQNAGGDDRAFVPDGQLCSGGNLHYRGFDLARTDWKKTPINTSGEIQYSFYGSAPHATKRWSHYITKDSYDMTQPLKWDDLELYCEYGNVALDGNKRYNMSCTLPAGYNGDRILYTVWERSDSMETFYSCSDVTISGLPGGSNNTGGSDSNSGEQTQAPQQAVMQSPVNGSQLAGQTATFTTSNHDSEYTVAYVGNTAGEDDYFHGVVENNRFTVSGLPSDGRTVYVTLLSYLDSEWQTNTYSYTAYVADTSSNTDTDTALYNLGTLLGQSDLVAGTKVTLRLLDTTGNGELTDLETHSIVVEENKGSKAEWTYTLATQVNAQSQYIRIGQVANAEATIYDVIAVRDASGNRVYSETEGMHFEVETSYTEGNNQVNDFIRLVLSASQVEVLNSARITISGAQSSGFDIQDAQYEWTVVDGKATIVEANALETEVIFNQSDAGQSVTLSLKVTDNGYVEQQQITILHNLSTINDVYEAATNAINKSSAGSSSIAFLLIGALFGLARRLIKK